MRYNKNSNIYFNNYDNVTCRNKFAMENVLRLNKEESRLILSTELKATD